MSGHRAALRLIYCTATFLLLGGVSSNGCINHGPAGTTQTKSTVDQRCDTIVNGKAPQGCPQDPPSASVECGGDGECACSLDSNTGFCGRCSSKPSSEQCVYCSRGYTCPANPCDNDCLPDPIVTSCPASAPISCGGGDCCPTKLPVCCAKKGWCAESQAVCNALDEPGGGGGGGGGGSGCGIPSGGCAPGQTNARLRTGCCDIEGGVAGCTDGCDSWWEVCGNIYGLCAFSSSSYSSCYQNGATATAQAAQGC